MTLDGARGELVVVGDGLHELVGDAHGVVGVLEEDASEGFAVRAGAVVASLHQRPCLLLFLDLALDEVFNVRVVDVEDDHLGSAACFAAGLDDAGEGVKAAHEAQRPEAVPPPERVSMEPLIAERFDPAPLPHLKSMPSVLARVRMLSSESSTELMKQAEHCGRL